MTCDWYYSAPHTQLQTHYFSETIILHTRHCKSQSSMAEKAWGQRKRSRNQTLTLFQISRRTWDSEPVLENVPMLPHRRSRSMNVGDTSISSTSDEKSEKSTKIKLGIEAKQMKAIKEVRAFLFYNQIRYLMTAGTPKLLLFAVHNHIKHLFIQSTKLSAHF